MTSSGKTNIKVVFGCMTFGKEGAEQSRVYDQQTAQQILDTFKKHGHRELDTARAYGGGSSEEMLKDLKVEQQGFQIATKIFPSARFQNMVVGKAYDHTKSCVLSTLDESLTALGMKKIDLYYLHAPDREVPFEETLEAVNEAYQAGKFERFGISNFKVDEVEAVVKIIKEKKYPFKVSVYQGLYNAVTRSAEAELIPTLRKHGISYYTYNPLGGGFFTGRIKSPSDIVESGSRFDANRTQGQSYRKRYYRDEYFEAIKIVSAAADKANLSMAEVALRWMQHHSELDTKKYGDGVIIGASSLGHIEQNLVDFEKGPLPEEVVRSVDEAWKVVQPNAPAYHF